MNPIFIEKTKDGEVFYDLGSRLAKERIILLCEEITDEVAGIIVPLLFLMDKENEEEPIQLWINSPGGDTSAFFAIYDVMKLIKSPVHTYCIGTAASAAALLLSSGEERYCTPNSHVMIHQVWVDSIGGTTTAVEIETKELRKLKDKLNELLARNTGKPVSKIKKDCENDKYFSAAEAVEYGIADRILVPTKKIPELKTRKRRAKKAAATTPPPAVEMDPADAGLEKKG